MTYPLVVAFLVSAAATAILAARRAVIVRFKPDEGLHLGDRDQGIVEQQKVDAQRLKAVDAWGKPVTALTAALGLAAYLAWWVGA